MTKRKRRSVTGLRKHKTPKAATSTVSTSLSQSPEIVLKQLDIDNDPRPAPVRAKRRRRNPHQALGEDNEYEHNIAMLEAQERYISQETIRSKWQVLSERTQESIMQLFKSIEMPVLASHDDERRRIEAQVAVGSVVRTLGNRLPRMPFPPRTDQSHFEYETTLNDIRKLEHRLDRIVHSRILLKAEKEREEYALKEEERKLEDLEEQKKILESIHLRQTAKHHALLPLIAGTAPFDGSDVIGWIEHKTSYSLGLVPHNPDANLQRLFVQIRDHLGSMKTNAKQTADIRDAVRQVEYHMGNLLRQQQNA